MIDGATLLGWADRDERRRRGGRPATTLVAAIAAGLALAAVAVAKGGWLDGARPVPSPGFLIAGGYQIIELNQTAMPGEG